jgi:hypothetical protein
MSQKDTPKTKEELLERIHAAREGLEKAISLMGPEELDEVLEGGWSIKDHLTHLAAWELGVAELLQRRSRFAAMGVEEVLERHPSEDELNAVLFQRNAGMTVSEAMAFFHAAHQQMLAALGALKTEDLFRPYADFISDAAADDTPPQDPVIQWVIGNTYEHFDLHRGYLEK